MDHYHPLSGGFQHIWRHFPPGVTAVANANERGTSIMLPLVLVALYDTQSYYRLLTKTSVPYIRFWLTTILVLHIQLQHVRNVEKFKCHDQEQGRTLRVTVIKKLLGLRVKKKKKW